MAYERDIRDKIIQIARNDKVLLFIAEVVSVDGITCTVNRNGTLLSGVRLTAYSDESTSLFIKPAMGAKVVIADLSDGNKRELSVIQYGEIESITIMGGKNGGFVIGSKLTDWMNKVAQDFQTLKTLLQDTPIAGNGAPAAIQFMPTTNSVKDNDIENTKVKH